jgi:hypothetical protein
VQKIWHEYLVEVKALKIAQSLGERVLESVFMASKRMI